MGNYDVVIVGGGPAGISAAIWCRRLGLKHILFEVNEEVGGQLSKIQNKIIDYPGVLTENGMELQKLLAQQISHSKCNIQYNTAVKKISPIKKTVTYMNEQVEDIIHYKYIIIATGSKQRALNILGEKEMLQRGEVYSATRDRFLFKGKNVAIVGGGDRAFEGALLLAEAGANVYLIHHSTSFRAKKIYKEQVLQHKNIRIFTKAVIQEIHQKSTVESVEIMLEGQRMMLPVAAVFVRIGVTPNNSLVEHLVETDEEGYVIVDKMGKSSIPSLFAIGDVCNTTKYSSIAASVGQGMIGVKHIYECLNEGDGPIYL